MRLIDADALMKIVDAEMDGVEEEILDAKEKPTLYTDDFRKFKSYTAVGMAHIAQDILEAPTVDAVPRWIPCEERLPEPTQEVLVTGTNGCVYTSRIVHGEFEYGGNVIAWMPLPKPYEGERKDDE